MARFPTPRALADAHLDEVLAAWAGLGYYARARALHRAARQVVDELGGSLPRSAEGLRLLPGIGRYTAGAVASIAFGRREPVVDGNVARVYARVYGIEDDVKAPGTLSRLWELAGRIVPARAPGDFNQALMELGATICTPRSPSCPVCPLAAPCAARQSGRQAELPLVRKRKRPARLAIDAGLVVRAGRWLLAKRSATGLFGGLWELPELQALPDAAVTRDRPLAEHIHQLSHRTIRYRVYQAELHAAPRPLAPYDLLRFHPPSRLRSLGVSSATLSLAGTLLEKTWPTPKPR
jgi:A/G-specific adenine glycosylase